MRTSYLFIIPIMYKMKEYLNQCTYHSDCMLPSVCCYGYINKCCIPPKRIPVYIYNK